MLIPPSRLAPPAALAIAIAVLAASLALPALAQPLPDEALQRARAAKSLPEALAALGVGAPEPGRKLLLEVPDIAVAGRPFTAKLTSRIPGTDRLLLLSTRTATPLLAIEEFTPGLDRSLSATLQLPQTGRVRAIARSAGKYYEVSREVKIALPAGGAR